MVENTDKLLVYVVTDDPEYWVADNGYDMWSITCTVSEDDGETCGPMVFNFNDEEQCLMFTRQVNNSMEPIEIGEEDEST